MHARMSGIWLCSNDTKFEKMEGSHKRFVRFQNNLDEETISTGKYSLETESHHKKPSSLSNSVRRSWEKSSKGLKKLGQSLQFTRVYTDEYEVDKTKIWDPRDKLVLQWSKVFLLSCLVAISVDPLFLYLPIVQDKACIEIDINLAMVVTVLRTITDVFYMFHMILQFRTAFVDPSSRVLGRGELVFDSWLIAKRYLAGDFALDLIAVLPLPQVFIWLIIPYNGGNVADNIKTSLSYIVLFQYLPRLYRIFPLRRQIVKTSGVVMETAWAGAAYNLLLYMLASHVIGALWYILAVEREDSCWRNVCKDENLIKCKVDYLDCGRLLHAERMEWFKASNITNRCEDEKYFNFGIYADALQNDIVNSKQFIGKYFYCLWWGLRNLSTLGQGLATSPYIGELIFSILLAILGLILFAQLIGNMQTYLASLTVRLEEMRLKRRDTEQWMRHRQLPLDLQGRVRSYEQYKWLETRGVDEGSLVKSLPKDLQRDIKRHLCLNLVRGVPWFASMDERILDAICERLEPTLFTTNTVVTREGDPVKEMLFIIRGNLKSETTDGGRTGFLNIGYLNPGDFCGDELLPWALDPNPGGNLPSSTRAVYATKEVEAFSLKAEDLKFVASQFRRLHSKQVQNTFRYHSRQWQTWAACSIQSAWHRYKRRKLAEIRAKEERDMKDSMAGNESLSLGAALYASRFAANAMRGVHRLRNLQASESSILALKLQKPSEPNFSADDFE